MGNKANRIIVGALVGAGPGGIAILATVPYSDEEWTLTVGVLGIAMVLVGTFSGAVVGASSHESIRVSGGEETINRRAIAVALLVFVSCLIVPVVNWVSAPLAPLIAGFAVGLYWAPTKTEGLRLGALLGILLAVGIVGLLAINAGALKPGSAVGAAGEIALASGLVMYGVGLTYAGTRLGISFRHRKETP